jgi:large subunit ribosomal protein L28e
MVSCSNNLVWECIKNNNAFLKKVNGRSKRSGTMRFSTEPTNLRSLSSFKHSGLANTQSVGIHTTEKNTAVLSIRSAKKSGNAVAVQSIPINKSFKKVVKTIESQTVSNYYRPDLKKDALAKYSCVYKANRVAKGIKKAVPVKKGRN